MRLSRQQLVHRLDSYTTKRFLPTFLEVIKVLDAEVIPLLRKCSLAGHAEFKTTNPVSAKPSKRRPQTVKPEDQESNRFGMPLLMVDVVCKCSQNGESETRIANLNLSWSSGFQRSRKQRLALKP